MFSLRSNSIIKRSESVLAQASECRLLREPSLKDEEARSATATAVSSQGVYISLYVDMFSLRSNSKIKRSESVLAQASECRLLHEPSSKDEEARSATATAVSSQGVYISFYVDMFSLRSNSIYFSLCSKFDNQAKRVYEFTHKRASADCSSAARFVNERSAKHQGECLAPMWSICCLRQRQKTHRRRPKPAAVLRLT